MVRGRVDRPTLEGRSSKKVASGIRTNCRAPFGLTTQSRGPYSRKGGQLVVLTGVLAEVDQLANGFEDLDQTERRVPFGRVIGGISCYSTEKQQGGRKYNEIRQAEIDLQPDGMGCQVLSVAGTGFEPATSRL